MLSVDRLELLLLVAGLVALLARRLRLPYSIGLVVAGVGLAAAGLLEGFPFTKELIFKSFLPPLIFEAAFLIRWKDLKANFAPVMALASVGVVLAAAVTAWAMVVLAHWNWTTALLFGALISATDPVSVLAMFKEQKVKGRVRLLLEAESLFNDAVAAILFTVVLAACSGMGSVGEIAGETLLRQVGGGLVAGAVAAGVALACAWRTEEHLVELTFTAVGAFGSFLLAEHFQASGVLAVLVAGLLMGNLGRVGTLSQEGRDAVEAFWEFAAFVANSIVFLLIGVREHAYASLLTQHWGVIALAVLACLLGRAVSVYGVSGALWKTKFRVTFPEQHLLVWGGLRGALALALAIGLPENAPYREDVLAVTFGVVAFSVLVQGLTMPLLMRRLGVGAAKRTAVDGAA